MTIQNVSWQGVEELAPLLHFREFPSKRMLLDPQQQQALMRITNSTETRAWVGQVLLLQVVATLPTDDAAKPRDPWRIQLSAPTEKPVTLALPRLPGQFSNNTRTTLLLLLLLLLLFLAVAILDSSESVWQWLLG